MRPDWEVVTWQLVDWLESYAATLRHDDGLELDLQRIAVIVASMGGYYALRAASDARIKACVAIDPFYEWDCGTRHISGWFMNTWTSGRLTERTIDRVNSLWHGLEHTVAVGGRAHPSLLGHRAHGHYLARDEAVLAAGRVSGAWSTVPCWCLVQARVCTATLRSTRCASLPTWTIWASAIGVYGSPACPRMVGCRPKLGPLTWS
ncbi:hypothetical protein V1507DRAFT_454552 [Lipomyces tetrasporus]